MKEDISLSSLEKKNSGIKTRACIKGNKEYLWILPDKPLFEQLRILLLAHAMLTWKDYFI